jgi:hypothetical protein
MTGTGVTDTSADQTRSRWPRRRWAYLTIAVAVVVAAIVMAAHPGGSRSRSGAAAEVVPVSPRPSAATPVAAAPAASGGRVGPVAVVLGVVAEEPALAGESTATADRKVAAWAAPQAQAGLERELASESEALASAKGGPYSFEVAVLAVRATTSGPSAMVDAWCAEVVIGPNGPLYGSYLTETFTLQLVSGRWMVASTSDTAGPEVGLPASIQPTPAAEAAAALAGFAPAGSTDAGGN